MVVTTIDNKDQFNGLLSEAGDKLVVVDFSAAWCGPCRTIAPMLDEWSEKDYANAMFLKVDVDDNEDIAKEFDVRAMPTFILFRNGKPVGDHVVGADPNALKKAIESNLKK